MQPNPHLKSDRVFVANATFQNQIVQYRKMKGAQLVNVPIGYGQQVALPEELTGMEMAFIEQQLRPYGLKSVGELKNVNEYVGLIFSVGTPVPVGKFNEIFANNKEYLKARGKNLRKEAAVAAAETLSGNDPRNPVPDAMKLQSLEVEIVEKEQPNKDVEVNEKIRVTNDLDEAERGGSDRADNSRRRGRGR